MRCFCPSFLIEGSLSNARRKFFIQDSLASYGKIWRISVDGDGQENDIKKKKDYSIYNGTGFAVAIRAGAHVRTMNDNVHC